MNEALPEPDATGAYHPQSLVSPAERFPPGTLLASRYRVVAPLGKGGMGEVYRADDLTLGQPVALKFLPPHLSADPDRLSRFRKEVAAARRVSHPNVCRVYDIAEHDGQSFLTMEFIDGEDLSSVLKRLGRVPEEKGIEIARQLCSALLAVHDQGMLHRDLKPANVMLDGRGKVRLTDFGLAAAAEDLSATEVRSGTPLYQAPEQINGKEVTVRSDLFALGLVLYELFTGKRAFAGAQRDTPPSKPSSHVSNLNPAVEALILRCLEPDPTNRPRSANEVLFGLPGGDPLAAAVAAGETPSPQLVADAGATGLIRPWVGAVLLAVVVAELIATATLYDRTIFARVPLPTHPEVLAQEARGVLQALGVPAQAADTASGFRDDELAEIYAYRKDDAFIRGEPARVGGPQPVFYYYRRADSPLTPYFFSGDANGLVVLDDNPQQTAPGMAGVRLDPSGRLLEFAVFPRPGWPPATLRDSSWKEWFDRAGLDIHRFKETDLGDPPPVFADKWLAWTEEDSAAGIKCRVEAGVLRERPVYFRVTGPWHKREAWGGALPNETASEYKRVVFRTVLAVMLVLAVRNLIWGRADIRTAGWMAGVFVVTALTGRAAAGWHATHWFAFAAPALGWAACSGLEAAVVYFGIEPAVRRRSPWRLTGWSRLFSGRWRDPLVGRDVLVGIGVGLLLMLASIGPGLVAARLGVSAGYDPISALSRFGTTAPASIRLLYVFSVRGSGLYFLGLYLVILLVVRRQGLALALVFTLGVGLSAIQNWGDSAIGNLLQLFTNIVTYGSIVLLLARCGLLAVTIASTTVYAVSMAPLTATTSAWYFPAGAATAAIILGVAAFAAYTATGGAKLFKEGFFGDD